MSPLSSLGLDSSWHHPASTRPHLTVLVSAREGHQEIPQAQHQPWTHLSKYPHTTQGQCRTQTDTEPRQQEMLQFSSYQEYLTILYYNKKSWDNPS